MSIRDDEPLSHGESTSPTTARDRPRLGHYERSPAFRRVDRQCHVGPSLSRHHRQGTARRLSRRDRPGPSRTSPRDQEFALADIDDVDSSSARSAGRSRHREPAVHRVHPAARNDLGRDNTRQRSHYFVPWIAAAGELKTKRPSIASRASEPRRPAGGAAVPDGEPIPEIGPGEDRSVLHVPRSAVIQALYTRATSMTCRCNITARPRR